MYEPSRRVRLHHTTCTRCACTLHAYGCIYSLYIIIYIHLPPAIIPIHPLLHVLYYYMHYYTFRTSDRAKNGIFLAVQYTCSGVV